MTTKTWLGLPASIAAWLLFAAVAFAPLPLGSNEPAAVAFWCIVLGACLVLAPVRSLGPGELALGGLAVLVVAAYAFVLHEQLADHPWLAAPHPLWHEAETALGVPLAPSVSIARHQPWFELGRPLVCVLAMACGFLVGADRGRAGALLKVIAWSGAAYAIYGILAHLLDPGHILWRDKDAYGGSVTGTFINRNTAGAYFGSCAVVWSLLLWQAVRHQAPRGPLSWRKLFARLFENTPMTVVLDFAMLFVCLAAMFLTVSRGAVLLSLLALIVAFNAYFRRDLPGRAGLLTALAASAAGAIILLQFMGAGINARFDFQGASDEGRLETYRATLRMIADHPWFGTGQGTFAYAFPAYRSSHVSMWGVWDIAHNTLLEIAADMGVPIAALVVAAWVVIFAVLVHGARVRRHDRIFPIAGLAVGILAVLHSLIDFSLQIPGYAIVVLSLIGAGLSQSFATSKSNKFGRLSGGIARQSREEIGEAMIGAAAMDAAHTKDGVLTVGAGSDHPLP
jgi:O-antigen ligase